MSAMEVKKGINKEEFAQAIQQYEETALKSSFEVVLKEVPYIAKYKGVRRSKLVAIADTIDIGSETKGIKDASINAIDGDNSLSENIELFTLGIVSDSERTALNEHYQESGLSLIIYDSVQLSGIKEFYTLFQEEEENNEEYDTALYEYLSMGSDTADAKNSLFYALLMMAVYQNPAITKYALEQLLTERYGKNVGNVGLALKVLRKEGRIAPPGKGDTISLTKEEAARLERSLREEKAAENDFMTRYGAILQKYGIADGNQIFERLKNAYQAQYQWHTKQGDDERKKDEISKENFAKIKEAVMAQTADDADVIINELRALCDNSDYLNRYSLSRSFLQLYRDPNYEQYVSNKMGDVFLDTAVLTYYLCLLSGKEDEYDFNWDNLYYQSVKSLVGVKNGSKEKISFAIPYDYLQETVGEMKKALQFSWFYNVDLPIPFETGNTFYNFYLAVKDAIEQREGVSCTMSFEDFAKHLGFDEVNPNASLFNKKAFTYLKYFFEKAGCEVIDPIQEHYDQFDEVRDNYMMYLQARDRKKTAIAANSDIRQAFFIANDFVDDQYKERDYFLSSWDKTLKYLRGLVNDELSIVTSYSVMSPGNLANKLAMRHFQITKASVSDDVFAYAESGFSFNSKVQSLYDNILTPYFANANNKNAALVVTMLKMEKNCQEAETKDEAKTKENTVLAEIFLTIIYALPDYDLSAQNLRDFLANKDNNDFIIDLFNEAFEASKKGAPFDISERFCAKIKEELLKKDEEIKL